jgi:hypothetical protein
MKRTVIAAAWLAGTTIPLIMAAVFLFGCCVLPFHHALHRIMPLCHVAAGILNGNHSDSHGDHHPSPPAPEKQKTSGAQLLTILRGRFSSLGAVAFTTARNAAQSRIAYRSFISLGAARCDQDVGLRALLIETYRI